jgi:chemotaxis response regulator CheB
LRQAVRKFLLGYSRFEIVGEARDYAETLAVISKVKPDLLLMDVRMPGLEARAIDVGHLAVACNCPIIAMSFSADTAAHSLAASTGAFRLLDKTTLSFTCPIRAFIET